MIIIICVRNNTIYPQPFYLCRPTPWSWSPATLEHFLPVPLATPAALITIPEFSHSFCLRSSMIDGCNPISCYYTNLNAFVVID